MAAHLRDRRSDPESGIYVLAMLSSASIEVHSTGLKRYKSTPWVLYDTPAVVSPVPVLSKLEVDGDVSLRGNWKPLRAASCAEALA